MARVDPVSHPWSEPAFDFWRPVGEAFPRVEADLASRTLLDAAGYEALRRPPAMG